MSTNNTYFALIDLKASPVAEGTAFLVQDTTTADGAFFWNLGDFTGQADDSNIIASDNEPLNVGAWVRQNASQIVDTTRSSAIAASGGADLIGFERAGASATLRTLETLLNERPIYVTEFGADPTGSADSYAACVAARTAAIAQQRELVFPSGHYLMSDEFNVGYDRLFVRGEGRVVIEAGYDGKSVLRCDAGLGAIAYQGGVQNLTLLGNGSADQDGFYQRNRVHNVFRDIRVRRVTRYGFYVGSDTLSIWQNCISSQKNDGLGNEVAPAKGMYVTTSGGAGSGAGATTACTFDNLIVEKASEHGLYLDAADCNNFFRGSAEGLAVSLGAATDAWGCYVGPNCNRNKFDGFYCEQNGLGDFDIAGKGNIFDNCEAYNADSTKPSFMLRSTSANNKICNGGTAWTNIFVATGSIDNIISDYDTYAVKMTGGGAAEANVLMYNVSESLRGTSRSGGISTPTFVGSSTAGSFGTLADGVRFNRVGRHVEGEAFIYVTSNPAGATGQLLADIQIPWSMDATNPLSSFAVGPHGGIPYPTGCTNLVAEVFASNRLRISGCGNNIAPSPVDAAGIGNVADSVRFNFRVKVA